MKKAAVITIIVFFVAVFPFDSIRFDSIRFEKQEARMMIDDAHAAVVVIIVIH